MNQEIYILKKDFHFEAAHRLPELPPEHKCSRLHGHSFRVTVAIAGEKDPQLGWVMDYADIQKMVQPILEEYLDHYYLNEVPGLENPTSENIAHWLWEKVEAKIPGLFEIVIGETCETACHFRKSPVA